MIPRGRKTWRTARLGSKDRAARKAKGVTVAAHSSLAKGSKMSVSKPISALKMVKKDSLAHLRLSTAPAKIMRTVEPGGWLGAVVAEARGLWILAIGLKCRITLSYSEGGGGAWNSADMISSPYPHCHYPGLAVEGN